MRCERVPWSWVVVARKKKSVIPRFPISFYNPVAGIKFYGTPCRIRLTFIWCNSGSHKTTLLAIKERMNLLWARRTCISLSRGHSSLFLLQHRWEEDFLLFLLLIPTKSRNYSGQDVTCRGNRTTVTQRHNKDQVYLFQNPFSYDGHSLDILYSPKLDVTFHGKWVRIVGK